MMRTPGTFLSRRAIGVSLAAVILAFVALGELSPIGGGAATIWWADSGWTCCACLALGGCILAARRGGPERRAWQLFSAGCATWLLGQCVWDYYELVARVPPPFPSLGDVGWLGFAPWFLAGIFALPRPGNRQGTIVLIGLDLAIVALALLLIGVITSQTLLLSSTSVGTTGKVVALAYPVAYLTVGFGAFLLMVRVPRFVASWGMWLLLLGLLCEGAGFVAWTPLLLNNTYHDGTPLDLVWMAGLLAIGLAGIQSAVPQRARADTEAGMPTLPLVVLGLIPTVLGTSVAIIVPTLAHGPVRDSIDLGARVLIVLIALRQLGAILENVRLYRAEAHQRDLAERRAARLSRVQEIGHLLGLELDPAGIGQLIVDTICSTLGYRLAVLNLVLNPDAPLPEQRIRPVATTGLDPVVAAGFLSGDVPATEAVTFLNERFRVSESYFVPAVHARALFQNTELPNWTPPVTPTAKTGWQPGDEFFSPLFDRRANRFLGFLSVDDPIDGLRPDAEIVEMLEIFADQTALAIGNARLYAEAHNRTRRSEAMGELLHSLGHQLEVDAVLRTGLRGLVRLTAADSATLFVHDSATQQLIRRASEGVSEPLPRGYTVLLTDEVHAARALESRSPVVLTTPATATETAALARLGCREVLVLPLVTAGEPSAVIFVNYKDRAPAAATDEHHFAQEVAGALGVALEKASLYERAQAQAMRDSVTDLANHRAIVQALDAALAGPAAATVAFLLLDIDNFKLFNDSYGHPTGDAVLRRVADHLRACSRDGDIVGRYGGDEFAVVLQRVDRRTAERIALRLARAVASTPHVEPTGGLIPLAVSIGVAVAPDDGQTRQSLVAVADARMYAAKHGDISDPLLLRSVADLLGETTFGILEGLVSAVDAKDRYTREHSLDVTRNALLLATALNLDEAAHRTLSVAGPLHDVGKIAVPDRVLRKPSALTDDEYETIKTHVTYGVAIVRGMLDDPQVLAAIAEHHERHDGKGYPLGLRGDQTSLLGRVMQIADAVSAMALDRPYRRGLPPERIIAELRRGAGAQFDPALVEPFIAAYKTLQREHGDLESRNDIAASALARPA